MAEADRDPGGGDPREIGEESPARSAERDAGPPAAALRVTAQKLSQVLTAPSDAALERLRKRRLGREDLSLADVRALRRVLLALAELMEAGSAASWSRLEAAHEALVGDGAGGEGAGGDAREPRLEAEGAPRALAAPTAGRASAGLSEPERLDRPAAGPPPAPPKSAPSPEESPAPPAPGPPEAAAKRGVPSLAMPADEALRLARRAPPSHEAPALYGPVAPVEGEDTPLRLPRRPAPVGAHAPLGDGASAPLAPAVVSPVGELGDDPDPATRAAPAGPPPPIGRAAAPPPPTRAPRAALPSVEPPRSDSPRPEPSRSGPPWPAAPDPKAPRAEPPHAEPAWPEPPGTEPPRTEPPDTEPPRTEGRGGAPSRAEPSRAVASGADGPRAEPPRRATPWTEDARTELACVEPALEETIRTAPRRTEPPGADPTRRQPLRDDETIAVMGIPPLRAALPFVAARGEPFTESDAATRLFGFLSLAHPLALSVDEYAALCAERDARPAARRQIEERYGIHDAPTREAVDRLFQHIFATDHEAYAAWELGYERFSRHLAP